MPPPLFMNMVREPVSRAVSTYYFARTGKLHECSLLLPLYFRRLPAWFPLLHICQFVSQ